MKKTLQEFAALNCVMPSLVCLAWNAFEKQGLTKRRIGYKKWEDTIAIATRDIEKLISLALQFDTPKVNAKPTDEEGAAWLNQK